jgi:phage terminase large subunit-like protein
MDENHDIHEQLREVDEEITRRLEQEKYKYYEPTGKGYEFIQKVGNNENFIVLYSAANGVGKTATGANILAHMFWDSPNPFFDLPLFNEFPYRRRGRIVSDPTNIDKNIIPELKAWFPHGRYNAYKAGKLYESVWETDTGFHFDIMSYEQDPREFEGATLGWAWFDEPPPESIFKATVARMRRGGIIFITATPLAGSAYLYDAFVSGRYNEVQVGNEGAQQVVQRRVGYVEADIESACKEHGVRGHLNHGDIENIIAEYTEEEKQARIYGKFQHLIGLVFKQWRRDVHIVEPFDVTYRDYAVYTMLDPHPRNPDAVTFCAVDRNNMWWIVDELYINVHSDSELAHEIKQKEQQYRIVRRICDPSAFITNQHDREGRSLGQRLSDAGLHFHEGTKQRQMSDRRIGEALKYREQNGFLALPPQLFVFQNCTRTIYEFEHYRWDEWTGKTAETREPKEKPMDKDDHMIENIGRFVILEPRFEEYQQPYMPRPEPSYDPYDTGSGDGSYDPYM